ncbi:MAG: SEC-C domain-containing protein, partial [Deltaproteobacteria bacterium]|nr:SEC-C domain-containing protein [Deltaproteobacteria bacterium]
VRIHDYWRDARRPATATPIRRGSPKVGRNDPCSCGSGLKFKKCCEPNLH